MADSPDFCSARSVWPWPPGTLVPSSSCAVTGRVSKACAGGSSCVSGNRGGAAVRFAFHEAGARGCELDAVHAWRCPSHDRADHQRTAGEPHLYRKERAATLIDEAVVEPVREYPTVRLHSAAAEGTAAKCWSGARRCRPDRCRRASPPQPPRTPTRPSCSSPAPPRRVSGGCRTTDGPIVRDPSPHFLSCDARSGTYV